MSDQDQYDKKYYQEAQRHLVLDVDETLLHTFENSGSLEIYKQVNNNCTFISVKDN